MRNELRKIRIILIGTMGMVTLVPILCECQQIQFSTIRTPEKAPLPIVVGMAQDNSGYIWLADGLNGLYRYDGRNLINYKHQTGNANSLVTDRLECIYASNNGLIWIGTFDHGLECFKPETETFTHFRRNNNTSSSICSDSVRAILGLDNGQLLIGTAHGLDKMDTNTGQFTHVTSSNAMSINHEHVRVLYRDRAGVIWVGCGSPFANEHPLPGEGGLYKLNSNTGKVTHYLHNDRDTSSLTDNQVGAIFEDSRGEFWVGTAGDGLHTMNRKAGIFKRYLHDPLFPQKLSRPALVSAPFNEGRDHITFINEDEAGCIWIGTFESGLNRYNPFTGVTEHYGANESKANKTSGDNYLASLKTKDNLLWVTNYSLDKPWQTLQNLVIPLHSANYAVLKPSFGQFVNSFASGSNGSIWLGTSKGLVNQKSDGTFDSFFASGPKKGIRYVTFLECGPGNELWVCTYGQGLFKFNTATKAYVGYYHSHNNTNTIASDIVYSTQLIAGNKLYVQTEKGLDLLDIGTGSVLHCKHGNQDFSIDAGDYNFKLKTDKKGNIFVGASSRDTLGLHCINTIKKTYKHYLKEEFVNSFLASSQNGLWVGTEKGLFRYDSLKDGFTKVEDVAGFLGNNLAVKDLLEDQPNSLLLSTRLGLLKLNTLTNEASLYGKSSGIYKAPISNSSFKSAQGELFFGDTAGYYHFFAESLGGKKLPKPTPVITDFYFGNTKIKPGKGSVLPMPLSQTKTIDLQYNQNNFAIGFDNIDFLPFQEDVPILYRLENYENNWRKAGIDKKGYYYNVPPGEYVFSVKALNTYGNWGEQSIAVSIRPPWWKTWWAYALYVFVAIAALWFFVYMRSRRLLMTNRLLETKIKQRTAEVEEQKKKITAQRDSLEKALEELQSTQKQLIQSEKMASLGELTAGIAHEIQNPLNFVNNFSEVSSELIDEAKIEFTNNRNDEGNAILNDVKQNLEKIYHHGKRADAIVKGMLLHSRKRAGPKEPTDINKLADEYLRLAYQGLRANDKSFNATLNTAYSHSIGKISVIPQDIGRVLLNVLNNAFYAVTERQKAEVDGYDPTVSVATKLLGDKVEISVTDNGNGIPSKIVDKIFQPFFTTKPTGQGTGLGLSLSYDIVKAHGGEVRVETKEGEGTEFIVILPMA